MASKPASPFEKPGTVVEIFSEDDAGIRTWSTGKVVRVTHNHVKVQYSYREQDADPRVEFVNIDKLRPQPSPQLDTDHVFESGDKVNVYNDKGSWVEGHVTNTLSDGRSFVYHNASKHCFLYPKEKLRAHWEWIDGHWSPSIQQPNQEEQQEVFKVGDQVEVSSDLPGYKGVWFVAKIVKVREDGKFLVEYPDFHDDNDSEVPLQEVDDKHIRPSPPYTDAKFKVLDQVDALVLYGWRTGGMITKVNSNKNKCNVYFKKEEKPLDDFNPDLLRRRCDWVDGKWEIASQGSSPKSDDE